MPETAAPSVPPPSGARAVPLLRVRGLRTWFPFGGRWFGERRWIRAVDGVDLDLGQGEVLGLVGESGCGKTTLGRSVLRLVEPTAGSVELDGVEITALEGNGLRRFRRRMQIIQQDPYAALSPRRQIRQILAEPLRLHDMVPAEGVAGRVDELLRRVGLESYFARRYPHEMSGGQRQRIAVARALALEPALLVADEPVSALDVSVQAQILGLLADLRRREGIAILFISHDLSVVAEVADRVAVMYRGRLMEVGPASMVIGAPMHPYTQALLSAVPRPDRGRGERIRLEGEPPPQTEAPVGCPFASRCPEAEARCRRDPGPALEEKDRGRRVACHLRA